MRSEPTTDRPIIFIHYGDSYYLNYVLKCAAKFNSNVVLIGDSSNKKYEKFGINHYDFDAFLASELLDEFGAHYARVGGSEFTKINKSKGGRDWTKFNFQKWFVLNDFCRQLNIGKLWTFDSDTMILKDLSNYSELVEDCDYTTMNHHHQLQGLLNSTGFLEKFCHLTISLFKDEEYLKNLITGPFKENPNWGFTMMRVFKKLWELETPKTISLSNLSLEEYYFDECVCLDHGMEMHEKKYFGRNVKKLFYRKNELFEYDSNHQLRKLVSINLSWVPEHVFFKVFEIAKSKTANSKLIPFEYDRVPLRYYFNKFNKKYLS